MGASTCNRNYCLKLNNVKVWGMSLIHLLIVTSPVVSSGSALTRGDDLDSKLASIKIYAEKELPARFEILLL